jgi:hypothetical protein
MKFLQLPQKPLLSRALANQGINAAGQNPASPGN